MSIINRWLGRLKAAWHGIALPATVELSDIAAAPIAFRVYSRVERYRVAEYGGERDVLLRFLDLLQPGDVVYDIGASVGLFALAAARRVGPGSVWAFEPDPETRARLIANAALNGMHNVQTPAWAVSDTEGVVTLYSDGAAGFAPSLVRQTRRGAPRGSIAVPARPLDAALTRAELPPPDVVKVDIEGAEALWLAGSRQLLSGAFGRRPRHLLLELHPALLTTFQSSVAMIGDQLARLGYRMEWRQTRADQEHHCYASDQ